ncbi:uncharacterized protein G2W53_004834 [Senna tora]|uniref:Uncharacterized protein n=1 Tax=Senna tora TaxID=362788 RepID=A0A835CII8_9FABA|nr:uncharacterized protein G2W53_004834 [Senna tora]
MKQPDDLRLWRRWRQILAERKKKELIQGGGRKLLAVFDFDGTPQKRLDACTERTVWDYSSQLPVPPAFLQLHRNLGLPVLAKHDNHTLLAGDALVAWEAQRTSSTPRCLSCLGFLCHQCSPYLDRDPAQRWPWLLRICLYNAWLRLHSHLFAFGPCLQPPFAL